MSAMVDRFMAEFDRQARRGRSGCLTVSRSDWRIIAEAFDETVTTAEAELERLRGEVADKDARIRQLEQSLYAAERRNVRSGAPYCRACRTGVANH